MRDIRFSGFDWRIRPDGELGRVENLEAFRDLIVRWLLTEPAQEGAGYLEEEVETRYGYANREERERSYDAPAADRLNGCLAWAPDWGAGIKRFVGRPVVGGMLEELRLRIRDGLVGLEGVRSVELVDVSAMEGRVTVSWRVETIYGRIAELTRIEV
jgi:hypothetical protein